MRCAICLMLMINLIVAQKTYLYKHFVPVDRGSTVEIDCLLRRTPKAVFLVQYLSEARAISAFAKYGDNSEDEAKHCWHNTTGRVIYNNGFAPWAYYRGMRVRSRLNTTRHEFKWLQVANINTLTIPGFTREDEGIYNCCIFNSVTDCATAFLVSIHEYRDDIPIGDQ
jgi:hypothetical protein